MKNSLLFLSIKDAFQLYARNWRKLLLPGIGTAFLLFLCVIAMMEIKSHPFGGNVGARGFLLLAFAFVIFLLEAGTINLLRRVFHHKEGGWKSILEALSWRRLVRLSVAAIGLLILWLTLALPLLLPLPSLGEAAKWAMLFLIPLQFYVILTLLEKPEDGSWKCFYKGFCETVSQRWEMWAVWLLAWLSYRIIARASWVLTWGILNGVAGVQVHGYWIWATFIALFSGIFPFGVFLLLSLRSRE